MEELKKINEFVVISGYINEHPKYISVGGYIGLQKLS